MPVCSSGDAFAPGETTNGPLMNDLAELLPRPGAFHGRAQTPFLTRRPSARSDHPKMHLRGACMCHRRGSAVRCSRLSAGRPTPPEGSYSSSAGAGARLSTTSQFSGFLPP
jgi:hypothetical protein